MKVCFCDLDGVVADNSIRAGLAEEAKRLKNDEFSHSPIYMEVKLGINAISEPLALNKKEMDKQCNDEYWRVMFHPNNVITDVLINGAREGLEEIERQGYRVIFLSSRLEIMRQATYQWLNSHNMTVDAYGFLRECILVPPAFREGYTKTVVWKIGTIQQLVPLFNISHVLLIDDNIKTLEAMNNAGMDFTFETREKL